MTQREMILVDINKCEPVGGGLAVPSFRDGACVILRGTSAARYRAFAEGFTAEQVHAFELEQGGETLGIEDQISGWESRLILDRGNVVYANGSIPFAIVAARSIRDLITPTLASIRVEGPVPVSRLLTAARHGNGWNLGVDGTVTAYCADELTAAHRIVRAATPAIAGRALLGYNFFRGDQGVCLLCPGWPERAYTELVALELDLDYAGAAVYSDEGVVAASFGDLWSFEMPRESRLLRAVGAGALTQFPYRSKDLAYLVPAAKQPRLAPNVVLWNPMADACEPIKVSQLIETLLGADQRLRCTAAVSSLVTWLEGRSCFIAPSPRAAFESEVVRR